MKFARNVFLVAGIYGIVVILPMYFMESRINQDFPPAITHPEYFYGFIGVTLAWQVAFLLIGRDPAKYHVMMLPAIIEKATYGIAIVMLVIAGRVTVTALSFAVVDMVLGVLFVISYLKVRSEQTPQAA